ncbi:helix-turn-helix transcriptional regulator [Modestobacter excelsi]|uniref:helix-turn-helix transcriptional regulator n=1 Tax=Modestobacter excelsi TaxID=2213161 RepID=UPI001C20DA63|nr:LuxR family transcriptional regulator [Modestobacter excelsi]
MTIFFYVTPHGFHQSALNAVADRSGLAGRTVECARVDDALDRAQGGHSSVLVLRGEAGIGKTAVLDRAVDRAANFRVIRISAIECEADLPYAGLQLLSSAMEDAVGRLEPQQRRALETAVGSGGGEPDRLLLGLAVRSLFEKVAGPRPLLCVIDDAQWLDRYSAQVLAFVIRRLRADPIAVLIAEGDPQKVWEFDGLPALRLVELSHSDARTLVRSLIRGRVDEAVIDRVIAEARGVPQALLDAAHGFTSAGRAGGFAVDTPALLAAGRLQEVLERFHASADDSRRLALLAAADPTGDPALLWRAAATLALPPQAAAPLESDGLVHVGSRVLFCDTALRSAVYHSASAGDRRAVHEALAIATDSTSAPDRRAWHLAYAADAPDDELAAELERCSPKAGERGGPAAAAAFLELATLMTRDSARRSQRALAAAAATLDAGATDAASRLLATAELGTLDAFGHGGLARLRAQVASISRRGDESSELFLDVARMWEGLDASVARDTYVDALAAAVAAGRLGRRGVEAVAKAVNGGQPADPRANDLLLDGLVVRFTKGHGAAHVPLSGALEAWGRDGIGGSALSLWLATTVAADLWDDEAWHVLTAVGLARAEDTGSRTVLLCALACRAMVDVHRGELRAASALVEEALALAHASGNPPIAHASLVLAGWSGEEHRALALFDAARRDAGFRGDGYTLSTASLAEAVLYNGLGRYDAALAAAWHAAELDELGLSGLGLVELIEAATRSGRHDAAVGAVERLTDSARASGTDWALGMEARSRALVTDGQGAEKLYEEAIDRLARSRITVHRARAQLLYGEWLRRQGRRIDARVQLRAAEESFVAMGAEAFAVRARRENSATGEKVRRRGDTAGNLTPQEARIAFLACDGLTNPEIGEQLFVSPRTVEYHLHKVFEKFGITSRRELPRLLDNTVSISSGRFLPAPHARNPRLRGRLDVAGFSTERRTNVPTPRDASEVRSVGVDAEGCPAPESAAGTPR